MNLPLYILWIFILILLIVFCILAGQNIKQIYKQNNEPFSFNTKSQTYCLPNGKIESLPEVQKFCCINNGIITPYRQFNLTPYGNKLIIQAETSIDYLEICKPFCLNYNILTNVCQDTNEGNPGYYSCINQLKPVDKCIQKSMPLARLGNIPYYAKEASWDNCKETVAC
jgi:hypothetical protein